MKRAFVLCVVLLALHGCTNVTHSSPKLHDGRWGDYNGAMTEQCALQAMVDGIDSAEIAKLFNKCVFEQGLTI